MSRLEEFGIRKVVDGPAVSLYVRGNCIAAVGSTQGSTGLMTDTGLSYLVWRGDVAMLASKGSETPASPQQLDDIRKFTEDLKNALST